MKLRRSGTWWPGRERDEQCAGEGWRRFQQERIAAERDRIRETHGEIGLTVLDILARHDPLDIVRDENPAEYEPVVRTIVPRLRSARCVEDAHRIVHEEAAFWLTDERAGPPATYLYIGAEVWEAARRQR